MVASAFAFAAMGALVKLAGERLPSQEIVLARALVTLVLTLGILRARKQSPWGTPGKRGLLLFRGLLGFLGLSCVYYAVTRLPLAESTVLQYLHPVFTSLLAAVFLAERVRSRVLLSCALSLAGVVLVTRPELLFGARDIAIPTLAVLVAVAGAFLSASAYVVVRKLASTESPLVIVFWFPLVAVPLSLPTVVPVFVLPTGPEWAMLAGVGVTAQLGQVWLTRGLELETAGRATAVSYLQVLFAASWGFVLFDELPTAWTVGGALLILTGVLLAAARDRRAGDSNAKRPPERAARGASVK